MLDTKSRGAPILKHKSEYVTGEKYSKSKIHSRIFRILTVVPYIKNTFLLSFFFHLKWILYDEQVSTKMSEVLQRRQIKRFVFLAHFLQAIEKINSL